MSKLIWFYVLLGVLFVIFAIYVVINRLGMPTVGPRPAGFWLGLWQGAIVLLSFITSWFDKNITIYQAGNNGFWYNLGYLLGVTIALGSGGRASKR
jgi:hypothetical protein